MDSVCLDMEEAEEQIRRTFFLQQDKVVKHL